MRAGELLDGRYLLIGELGRGGFGVVWEAYDERLGRPAAVKTLRQDRAGASATDLERLHREVRVLAGLAQPNVVTVLDVGAAVSGGESYGYLVMELLHGPTLAQVIAGGRVGLPLALDWARQLCAALGAAHASRVIHRDIKPENMMFATPARELLKVLDFGIAQIGDNRDALTTEGSVIGSARYLAPERWRGEPGSVRSDLYAVGCVLYELFTGVRPFTATNQFGLMTQHLDEQPQRPELPDELADLLLQLLAKEPADRPADAAEVARRLAAAAEAVRALRGRADAAFQAATEGRPAAVGELRALVGRFALAFGPADGRTLRTCHDLAIALLRLDRPAEAHALLTELLAVAAGALGADHPDVADVRRRLDGLPSPAAAAPPGALADALRGERPVGGRAVNRTGA